MLSEKQADFILAPFVHTLDVAEGTPRSGKTTACVLRYWSFLNISPDSSHLIVAATQTQAFRLAMDADGNGLLHLFQNPVIKHDDYGDYLEALADSGPKKSITRAAQSPIVTRASAACRSDLFIFARSTSCIPTWCRSVSAGPMPRASVGTWRT